MKIKEQKAQKAVSESGLDRKRSRKQKVTDREFIRGWMSCAASGQNIIDLAGKLGLLPSACESRARKMQAQLEGKAGKLPALAPAPKKEGKRRSEEEVDELSAFLTAEADKAGLSGTAPQAFRAVKHRAPKGSQAPVGNHVDQPVTK